MYRFGLAALMITAVFDSADATKIQATAGIPECREDAVKFCNAVLFDLDKRRARMRAHRAQLSRESLAAIGR
jgi:hypothetical protein